MKLWIIVVVFLFIFHSYAKGNPLGNFSSSSGGFSRQQSQFGESIRDWYRDMKARIFGSNPPDISGITDQTKQASQQQISFLGGFLLDLSKVSFDPQRDWGFRLGNWYIIKKNSDNSGAGNFIKSSSPAIQEVPAIEFEFDDKIPTVVSIDDIIFSTSEKTVEIAEQDLPEETNDAVDVPTDEIISSTTEITVDTTEQNPPEEPINVDDVPTDEIISSTTEQSLNTSEQNLPEKFNDDNATITDGSVEIISPKK